MPFAMVKRLAVERGCWVVSQLGAVVYAALEVARNWGRGNASRP